MIFVGAKVGSIGLGIYGMVGVAAKFLKRHPSHITFYAPFVTWLFCFLAGTAHTRPQFHGEAMSMNSIIEIIMMSIAALIQLVGKADVGQAVKGNVFASGMNAMVAIFGVLLFVFSIMLFSQAATVKTLYPVGLALGVPPQVLLALFPAVNGYFFLPNYPTEVAPSVSTVLAPPLLANMSSTTPSSCRVSSPRLSLSALVIYCVAACFLRDQKHNR